MENRSASLECEEANSYLFGASTSIAFAGIVYLKGSVAFCFAPSQRKAKNRLNSAISVPGEITVHDFDPFRVTIQATLF